MIGLKPCIFCSTNTKGIRDRGQIIYVCENCVEKIEMITNEVIIPIIEKDGAGTDPSFIAKVLKNNAEFITGITSSTLLDRQKKVSNGESKDVFHISHYANLMCCFTKKKIVRKYVPVAMYIFENAKRWMKSNS